MKNNPTILVVEDDSDLRRMVRSELENWGGIVMEAESGKAAHRILRTEYLDLILLDLRLGDMHGIEILKTIRRQDDDLPVIIVSSIHDQEIIIDGFDIGCDDYITKPFYSVELLSRVKRLLKRSRRRFMDESVVHDSIRSGPFQLNIDSLTVQKNGEFIPMRKKLFNLFLFFVENPHTTLTKETLFDRVWDAQDEMNENSLYVHIRQLRLLVEDDPSQPRYIQTVRNLGFMYTESVA